MMSQLAPTHSLDYKSAFRYAAAWAVFDHDNVASLHTNAHQFEGKLGSLNFQYSEQDRLLHVWAFIMPGAGPFVTKRPEIKSTLDSIAQQKPAETAGGVFDIRRLPWNDHGSPRLEPCLYLRVDIVEESTPVDKMVQQLNNLSMIAIVWNRHKMPEVLDAYWKAHPQQVK